MWASSPVFLWGAYFSVPVIAFKTDVPHLCNDKFLYIGIEFLSIFLKIQAYPPTLLIQSANIYLAIPRGQQCAMSQNQTGRKTHFLPARSSESRRKSFMQTISTQMNIALKRRGFLGLPREIRESFGVQSMSGDLKGEQCLPDQFRTSWKCVPSPREEDEELQIPIHITDLLSRMGYVRFSLLCLFLTLTRFG